MTVTAGPNMPINLRGGQDASGDNIGIDTEFGDQSGADPISDYYAGATSGFVSAGTTNGAGNAIPASGRVRWSDFYGAAAELPWYEGDLVFRQDSFAGSSQIQTMYRGAHNFGGVAVTGGLGTTRQNTGDIDTWRWYAYATSSSTAGSPPSPRWTIWRTENCKVALALSVTTGKLIVALGFVGLSGQRQNSLYRRGRNYPRFTRIVITTALGTIDVPLNGGGWTEKRESSTNTTWENPLGDASISEFRVSTILPPPFFTIRQPGNAVHAHIKVYGSYNP